MTTLTQSTSETNRELISRLIRDVPDFPQPGVLFKDIMPLLARPSGLAAAVTELVAASPREADVVVGTESRGFIFAAPLALALGVGFVPIRRAGKLPGATISETFDLEYGTATMAIPEDAIAPGSRVLVVDDVLATGGTIAAAAALVSRLGAEVLQVSVLLELPELGGRDRLAAAGITDVAAIVSA